MAFEAEAQNTASPAVDANVSQAVSNVNGVPALPQQLSAASAEPSSPVTDAAAAPATPVVDPRAEINSLAESLGFDPRQFSGFGSVDEAREAVFNHVDSAAREGLGIYQQFQYGGDYAETPVPQPPAERTRDASGRFVPVAPAAEPSAQAQSLVAQLGLDADDPTAKVIAALDTALQQQRGMFAEQQKQLAALNQNFDRARQQQKEAQRARMHQEAEDTVSGWNSPEYGKQGQRTAAMQARVYYIFSIANGIVAKAIQDGRPEPSIQARLNQAKFLVEYEKRMGGGNTQAVQQATAMNTASPPPAQPSPVASLAKRWSDDPNFMAQFSGVSR